MEYWEDGLKDMEKNESMSSGNNNIVNSPSRRLVSGFVIVHCHCYYPTLSFH